MTEKEFQKELLSAFEGIGYSKEMRLESVSFVGENASSHTAKAVLYSDPIRRDSENAVIAIQETEDARNPKYAEQVKPYYALGTPIIVLAEYRKLHQGFISVTGLVDESQFQVENDNVIPFSKFKEYVKRNRENFSPRKLEEIKFDPSQSRKFKVEQYLFERILKISEEELVKRYHSGLKEVIEASSDDEKKVYENSLILLASRILRDKLTVEKKKTWSVNSVSDLIEGAKGINEYFHIPLKDRKNLEPMLEYLPAHFDYSQLGIEALGHFYETAILSKDTKQKFGIYYTPSIIAKTILKRMPIEEIRPENRILLDPTCGSGSFLVEGYKRLTQATYLKVPVDKRHENLINTMYGNDNDGFAGTIAKLTLLLFHPPHKNNWKISDYDAKEKNFVNQIISKLGNKRPTIIAGNLPFKFEQTDKKASYEKRAGHTPEGAALILNNCLTLLEENGLLGLILPEGIKVHENSTEKDLRSRILKEFQVLEQWELPIGWFRDTNKAALVWILRKKKQASSLFKLMEISNPPIRKKDIPDSVKKKTVEISGSRTVFSGKLPDDMVAYDNETIMNKISKKSNKISGYYKLPLGLELNKKKVLFYKSKKDDDYKLWAGIAKNKDQFTNLRISNSEFINIKDSNNFPKASQRLEIRTILEENRSSVFMKVNRNNPNKWAVASLIDILTVGQQSLAPKDCFYPIYRTLKNNYEIEYLVSIWILLNHSISNYYFRNISPLFKVTTKHFRNFPLPDSWNDIEKIKSLSSKAKQLLDLKRKYDSKYKSEDKADKNNAYRSEEELRDKILSLVKETDKMIYDMYGFTKSEIRLIEDFFGDEKRPGLEELGEDWKQFKSIKKKEKKAPIVNEDELKDFGTSFETLEVDYEELRVKLVIHGLRDREDELDAGKDGIWIPITPYMPGWMLQAGANGMIYLKTYDSVLIQEYPDFFIKDFSLMKNAYKTVEEIEENVFGKSTKQDKKVG